MVQWQSLSFFNISMIMQITRCNFDDSHTKKVRYNDYIVLIRVYTRGLQGFPHAIDLYKNIYEVYRGFPHAIDLCNDDESI